MHKSFCLTSLILFLVGGLAIEAPARDQYPRDIDLPATPNIQVALLPRQERAEIIALPNTEKRVMGYTDKPIPEGAEMPPSMKHWMHCVEEAIEYAELHPEMVHLGTADTLGFEPVSPILGDIEWKQRYPFNALCPDSCLVGCVATATAQVMYHYRYPDHGFGSYTWTYDTITHHVDYGSATYLWDKMFDKATGDETEDQIFEVAQLCYHCGVGLEMQWGKDGSGTFEYFIPALLRQHYGYNDRIALVARLNRSYYQWLALLQEEIYAGRPVIFSASDPGAGGHAFVVDGIDERGYYHVNWGWDGNYNGYYDINIMRPLVSDAEGLAATFGFGSGQTAIINCTPEQGVGTRISPLAIFQVSPTFTADSLDLLIYCDNTTRIGMEGSVLVSLVDTLGREAMTLKSDRRTWTARQHHVYSQHVDFRIPADSLDDGSYRIVPYFVSDSLMCCELECPYNLRYKLCVTVRDGEIVEAATPYAKVNDLYGCNFSLQDETLETNTPYEATLDVLNRGSDTFAGQIHLLARHIDGEQVRFCDDRTASTLIEPGETRSLHFDLNFDKAGTWTVRIAAYNFPAGVNNLKCASESGMTVTVIDPASIDVLPADPIPTAPLHDLWGHAVSVPQRGQIYVRGGVKVWLE